MAFNPRGKAVAAAAALLAFPALTAPPVQAQVLDRDMWQNSGSNEYDCDGFAVHQDWTARGLFLLKGGRGGDYMPYFFDNIQAHSVFTAPETERWYTVDQIWIRMDTRITNVSGNVYTIESQLVGQPFKVTAMDGKVAVYKDRGRLLIRGAVDSMGTADPDDDVEVQPFDIVAINGPHPGVEVTTCDLADELLRG
jgi:hypothetical protein